MALSTSPKNAQPDLGNQEEFFNNKKFKVVPLLSSKNANAKQINFDEFVG